MEFDELAANAFRASLTGQKLRNDPAIQGRTAANQTHYDTGKAVRQFIIEQGGTPPEQLPTPTQSVKELQQAEQRRIAAAKTSAEQSPLFSPDTPDAGDEN